MKKITNKFLLLPFGILGSMSNANVSSDVLESVQQDPSTNISTSVGSNPTLTYNRHNPNDNTHNWLTTLVDDGNDEQRSQMLKLYTDTIKEDKYQFSFPNSKYYHLPVSEYTIYNFQKTCHYKSWKQYRDHCPGIYRTYEDKLITQKPRILVNSLKGFDLNNNHPVEYRPNNLEYDDWTTQSILNKVNHVPNWKEQYGFFRKNVFFDTHVKFDNKGKQPFTSQTYSLSVPRKTKHETYIPVFTGFHRGRKEMNGKIGFEAYDEININYEQLLVRNHYPTSVSIDVVNNNPGLNLKSHTQKEYGWYNWNYRHEYESYQHATRLVERLSTGIDDNYGSKFMSWSSDYHNSIVKVFTPVPFTPIKEQPFELRPMSELVPDWKDDLFHINYHNALKFDKPVFTDSQVIYPFSLSLDNIKNLTSDVKSFFGISSNFSFYLNYTHNNNTYQSQPYNIQDLIQKNALLLNVDSLQQDHKIDNVYLSLEPLNKDQVELMHTGHPQWNFGVYADEFDGYSFKSEENVNQHLDSIKIDKLTNIAIDEEIVRSLSTFQLYNHRFLSLAFSAQNKNNGFPISSDLLRLVLKPQLDINNTTGSLTISFFDPYQNKNVTHTYENYVKSVTN